MRPEDALSSAIARTNLVALLERLCPTPDTARLHPERGGLIRDPRPGFEEREPSFSVSRRNGVWLWHRFGRAGAQGRDEGGNAYHLLLSLGYAPRAAAETLLRAANLEPAAPRRPLATPAPAPVSRRSLEALHRAQRSLERTWPAPCFERRGVTLALARRVGLGVREDGAILVPVRDPSGALRAVKLRRGDRGDPSAPRYRYLDAGGGASPWCSPGYGASSLALLCEGELNAIVVWGGLAAMGLAADVQGIAGAGAAPLRSPLRDRTVRLMADDDAAGRMARGRWAPLARDAGARSVGDLEPLPHGWDACDFAGHQGLAALGAWLCAALERSAAFPPIAGAESGASRTVQPIPRQGGAPCSNW